MEKVLLVTVETFNDAELQVEEKKSDKPMVYLISTCPRCKRIKQLLDDMEIEYDKIFVDLIPREESRKIIDMLRDDRTVVSFPVIVVGDRKIIGASSDDVLQLFGGSR